MENIEVTIKDTSDFLQLRTTMEYVVNNVEIVCISCIICNICHDIVKPKQGKKGKKNLTETKGRDSILDLADTLKTTMIKFDTSLHLWSTVSTQTDIATELECLNLNNNGNSVFQNILSSHVQAVNELQSVLKTKFKFIGVNS
ncbi:hypothetical protein HHI36_022097 [Cryptolaemus montrouzieri]|uniref:Uncharacterized protein n=1 Tax=Cryptolaemus montrouzieri TaxID=559131 RepID=A0ABD2MYP6_9CUCU